MKNNHFLMFAKYNFNNFFQTPALSKLFFRRCLVLALLLCFFAPSISWAAPWFWQQDDSTQTEQVLNKSKESENKRQSQQIAAGQAADAEELTETIRRMADSLFANLEDSDPETGMLADGLAVTVFVDLKKLTRTSSFGRYLSEQLMTEFQQRGYTVLEARKSTSILIQEKRGEYGLSRDLKEINTALTARTMLTGTYTIAGNRIMVNAKILDNKDSTMLSSATVLFDKTELASILLSDSASSYPKKNEYIYMKQLEL